MRATQLCSLGAFLLVCTLLCCTSAAQAQSAFNQAKNYHLQGDLDSAVDYYTLVLNETPSHTAALFQRAQVYYELGRFGKARYDLDDVLYYESKNPKALELRGHVLLAINEPKLAYEDYTAATQISPTVDGFVYKGEAAKLLGYYKEAIYSYDAALQMNWQCVEAFCGKGDVYAACDYNESALANYNTALAYAPNDAISLHNRGQVYWKMGKYDLAIQDFSAAISIQPQGQFYINRALCRLENGNPNAAKQDAIAALNYEEKEGENPGAYVCIGLAELQLGQYDDARLSFDVAMDLEIENAIFWKYIGRAFYRLNDPRSASVALGNYLDVIPYEEQGEELLLLQKCHDQLDAQMMAQKPQQVQQLQQEEARPITRPRFNTTEEEVIELEAKGIIAY